MAPTAKQKPAGICPNLQVSLPSPCGAAAVRSRHLPAEAAGLMLSCFGAEGSQHMAGACQSRPGLPCRPAQTHHGGRLLRSNWIVKLEVRRCQIEVAAAPEVPHCPLLLRGCLVHVLHHLQPALILLDCQLPPAGTQQPVVKALVCSAGCGCCLIAVRERQTATCPAPMPH